MQNYTSKSIKEVCIQLQKDGLSLDNIGKLLNVSRLQVNNYIIGKTKTPKPQVAFNIWDNVKLEGLPVLLDLYKNPEHLTMTRDMIEKAKEL